MKQTCDWKAKVTNCDEKESKFEKFIFEIHFDEEVVNTKVGLVTRCTLRYWLVLWVHKPIL